MRTSRLYTILAIGAALGPFARRDLPAQTCSCLEAVDSLAATVETVYAGYPFKVTPWTEPRLRTLLAELRDAARSTEPAGCLALLDRYVDWFEDGHLRLTQSDPAVGWTAAPTTSREDPSEVRALVDARAANASEIEGLWQTPWGTVGVVPADDGWHAVALESAADGSAPGDVVARIRPRIETGVYPITLAREGHLVEHQASLVEPARLYLPEEAWVRGNGASLPEDAFAPTLDLLDERTALIRFPSMLPQHHATLVELLERRELLARPHWIIDLRGNAGGSDGTYMPLLPLLYTDTIHTQPGAIRASPHARTHFERFIDPERPSDAPPWVRELLDDMEENPEGMIAGGAWNLGYDTRAEHPRLVAIVIDGSNGSSAETFLLKAIQSSKVRTFGRNTAGVVDYLNPTAIGICPGSGLRLWSPTSVRHRFLPLSAVDPHGLRPDERIPDHAHDWVAWVYERMRSLDDGQEQ